MIAREDDESGINLNLMVVWKRCLLSTGFYVNKQSLVLDIVKFQSFTLLFGNKNLFACGQQAVNVQAFG